jgi:hypothetical protein
MLRKAHAFISEGKSVGSYYHKQDKEAFLDIPDPY